MKGMRIFALEPLDPALDWNDGLDYWEGSIWAGFAGGIELITPDSFISLLHTESERINKS